MRATTADGADVRVLLEAVLAGADLSYAARLADALIAPEIVRTTASLGLAEVVAGLTAEVARLPEVLAPAFGAIAVRIERLDLVAIEHLLVSPSSPDGG